MLRNQRDVAVRSCKHVTIRAWPRPRQLLHKHTWAGTSKPENLSQDTAGNEWCDSEQGSVELGELVSTGERSTPSETGRAAILRTMLVVRNATAYPRDTL